MYTKKKELFYLCLSMYVCMYIQLLNKRKITPLTCSEAQGNL